MNIVHFGFDPQPSAFEECVYNIVHVDRLRTINQIRLPCFVVDDCKRVYESIGHATHARRRKTKNIFIVFGRREICGRRRLVYRDTCVQLRRSRRRRRHVGRYDFRFSIHV